MTTSIHTQTDGQKDRKRRRDGETERQGDRDRDREQHTRASNRVPVRLAGVRSWARAPELPGRLPFSFTINFPAVGLLLFIRARPRAAWLPAWPAGWRGLEGVQEADYQDRLGEYVHAHRMLGAHIR